MNAGYSMNNYYDENAKEYIENTINTDMSLQYNKFIEYLPKTGHILDIGFGSGRDMIYFKTLGYEVSGIDTSIEFVNNMKNKGYNVKLESILDIEYNNEFEAIWACASLLHIEYNKLKDVFKRCFKALKTNGVMYLSFKYGDFEGELDGRHFTYLNEEKLNCLLLGLDVEIKEVWISSDKNNRDINWLNCILTKK